VAAYGDAPSVSNFAGLTVAAPAVAIATADANGYWVAAADGGVFSFGDAPYFGSVGGTALYAPVVGMAAAPGGKGYWLVASDGGVFSFGSAGFHGSMGGKPLDQPVVAMAATPSGNGYWLVAADGGVFSFGDAQFFGSMGGKPLNQPMVGMASTPSGNGYWMVAADGGVFSFGGAGFRGSAAEKNLGTAIMGIAATPSGNGYWMVANTAAVLPFGDAVSYGPSPNKPQFPPSVGIAATPDGQGYWLLQPDSISTSFSTPVDPANGAAGVNAVQIAASQIGPDLDNGQGAFCNPYGPCEEWCALFATWVWNEIGVGIPRYGFVGSVFDWAVGKGLAQGVTSRPAPGDVVIYGTGPQNATTSPHIAIVAEVWPNGDITTIDGDAGPEPIGQLAVTTNGPFLPADSSSYNGMPIYAFARP
jgi:hypothetical protein